MWIDSKPNHIFHNDGDGLNPKFDSFVKADPYKNTTIY